MLSLITIGFLFANPLVLTNDNFTESVSHGKTLVRFYAEWCGKCEKMMPFWFEASNVLKDQPITFADVNCHRNEAVCDKYGINGYPIIKLLDGGKEIVQFDERMVLNDLLAYPLKALHDPLQHLSLADTKALISQNCCGSKSLLVDFTAGPNSNSDFKQEATDRYGENVRFVHCDLSQHLTAGDGTLNQLSPELRSFANEFNIPVSLFEKGELSKIEVIAGFSDKGQSCVVYDPTKGFPLKEWMVFARFPLVPPLDVKVNKAFKQTRLPNHLVAFAVTSGPNEKEPGNETVIKPEDVTFLKNVKHAARKISSSSSQKNELLSFPQMVLVSVNSASFPYFMSHFGLQTPSHPTVFLHNFQKNLTWFDDSETEWSPENIISHLTLWSDGTLPPVHPSSVKQTPSSTQRDGQTTKQVSVDSHRYDGSVGTPTSLYHSILNWVRQHMQILLIVAIVILTVVIIALFACLFSSPAVSDKQD